MAHILLKYQAKHTEFSLGNHCKVSWEAKELTHNCDPNKTFLENLDDAFCVACERGCDPNKQIRWKEVN